MSQWQADYNAAVDRWNNSAQESGDKLRYEQAKEQWELRKKLLEKYEEDLDLMVDETAKREELKIKKSALALEAIQYKLTVKVEVNEKELTRLQYFVEKWTKALDTEDESM